MNLTTHDISIFILSIAVMLFAARAFGELFRKINQPMVIGEIVAGIVLGPTVFGYIFPGVFNYLFNSSVNSQVALEAIFNLAIIMMMIVTGLEVDLSIVFTQGKKAAIVSLFSILMPFAIGFAVPYFFPSMFGEVDLNKKLYFSLFIGTALSVTALPVVVRMLMDLNIFKSEVGTIIITAAMFTDIFGWVFFSFILSSMGHKGSVDSAQNQILIIAIFIIALLLIGRKIFSYLISILQKHTTAPGAVINFIFILGFLGGVFTESIGVHSILGAFLIGIAIGDSVHLKEETREIVQQFATNIFAPLFFVSIGLRINFIQNFSLVMVVIFLLLSIIGKVSGSILGSKLSGIKTNDAIVIGLGMNSYGAMQIVLSLVALQFGLINETVFVGLVVLAILTSVISAPLMALFIKKNKGEISFKDLIKKENIYFTRTTDKNELIKEICLKASQKNKFQYDKVLDEVLKREALISTGLANHLAIPHAKLNIQKPIVEIAVNKDGLDFNSLDGLNSKVIILLLTPIAEPEVQLKYLSEIAKIFSHVDLSNKIADANSSEAVVSLINQVS